MGFIKIFGLICEEWVLVLKCFVDEKGIGGIEVRGFIVGLGSVWYFEI